MLFSEGMTQPEAVLRTCAVKMKTAHLTTRDAETPKAVKDHKKMNEKK